MTRISGIIYALLSSAAFGLMPIFAKYSYNNGSNAFTALTFRYVLAALMLLLYFISKNLDLKINKKQLFIALLIGGLGYTSTGITLFLSYNYVPVGVATTMHFVYPGIVIVLNYFVYKEALTKNKLLALFLSLAGVYVLIGINTDTINPFGSFLAVFSGLTYAGCVIGMNHSEIKKLDNKIQVFYFSLAAGIVFLLITVISGHFKLTLNFYTIFSYIGISFVSTIISILLFIKALKIIGASSASILATFEPIVSIILGIILFKEAITMPIIIGTLLILISVAILAGDKKLSDSTNFAN